MRLGAAAIFTAPFLAVTVAGKAAAGLDDAAAGVDPPEDGAEAEECDDEHPAASRAVAARVAADIRRVGRVRTMFQLLRLTAARTAPEGH